MASYKIVLKPSVGKDLKPIPQKTQQRIIAMIQSLASEPLPVGVKKLEASERTYRVRVGDYRIIYEFEKLTRTITIQYVRHRSIAYR